MQLFNLVAIGPANLISGGVIDAAGFSLSSALFATVNGAAATKPTGVDFDNLLAAFQQQPSAPKMASSPLASLATAPASDAKKGAAPLSPVGSVSMNADVDTVNFNDVSESEAPLQRLLVSQSKPPAATSLSVGGNAPPKATEASGNVTVDGMVAEVSDTETETSGIADAEPVEGPHKPARTRSKHESATSVLDFSNSNSAIAPDVSLPTAMSNDVTAEVHHIQSDETEAADIHRDPFTSVSHSKSVWPQAMTLTATPVSQQAESGDSSATGTAYSSETVSASNKPASGQPQQSANRSSTTDNTEPAAQNASDPFGASPSFPTSAAEGVVEPKLVIAADSVPAVIASLPQQIATPAPVTQPLPGRGQTPLGERKTAASISLTDVESSPVQLDEIPLSSTVDVISNSIEAATLLTTEARSDETKTSAPTTSSEAPVANPNSSQPIDAAILSAMTSLPPNVATSVNGSQQPTTLRHSTVEHLANVTVQQATLVEAGGNQRFQIRLDPPDLGEVVIDISRGSDGQYDISVSAASPETHALLEQQSADITQALNDQGMSLNGFDLSHHQHGSSEEILQQQEQAEIARLRGEVISNSSHRSEQPASDGSISFRA